MNIEEMIATLLDSATIENYPHPAPHDAPTPNVTYQQISPANIRTHEGYVANRERWQLNCWAHDPNEKRTLFNTVKALFDLNQTDFELAYAENELDLPDADTGLYRKVLEVLIWK